MMAVLGFHLFGHDPAVAAVVDGRLVGSWELERVTRDRYGLRLPFGRSGELPTDLGGLDLRETVAAYLAILEPYVFPLLRGRFEIVFAKPWHDRYVEAEHEFLRSLLAAAAPRSELKLDLTETAAIDHNLSHAALAFFTSPFERSHVFAYEGMGNDGQTVLYRAEGLSISRVAASEIEFGRSYDHNGRIIGGNLGERLAWAGKLMGLASYGRPRQSYERAARRLISHFRKETFRREYEAYRAARGLRRLRIAARIRRDNGVTLSFDGADDPDAQDWMNSFQRAWTDAVLELLRERLDLAWSRNVCVSGGCALNVITNSAIRRELAADVYVPPNPNDSGLAAGAALYHHHVTRRAPRAGALGTAYLGFGLLDEDDVSQYVDEHPNAEASPEEVVARLRAGKIIGIVQGRSEAGPRALGNRSIVCDPGSAEVRERLNDTIKFREWFRPFAPVVREEDADRYFEPGPAPIASPYMSFVVPVREEWRSRLPAVTHVDGSARVQTLRPGENPLLSRLLAEMERQAGYGVLLNTSFNVRGEPIITTLADAFAALHATGLDGVYCFGRLFERVAAGAEVVASGGSERRWPKRL